MRKRLLSLVTGLALAASVAAPAAIADESIVINLPVTDSGSFDWGFWVSTVNVPSQAVDWDSGATYTTNPEIMFYHNDTRALSPGWTLTISAPNLTQAAPSPYYIENQNIKVSSFYFAPHSSCLGVTYPANPSNPFVTLQNPAQLLATPADLSTTRTLATSTSGRGCGSMQNSIKFTVTVPAGSAPGSYSTTFVATEGSAPTS
jgi:hypothetical protein